MAGLSGKTVYQHIRSFQLTGGKVEVSGLVLKRDRTEMTFTGSLYFAAPIAGKVTGAVFIGQGKFKADLPPDNFEKLNANRLLGVTDTIESDFKTAVLRFSDDTFEALGQTLNELPAAPEASSLASENDSRIIKETGANLSARIAASIFNNEKPGFFFASFDGGKRGRFSLVLDYQNRVPTDHFGINAGEAGLIFKYDSIAYSNDIWLAFYALSDYERGSASYADQSDLVDITNYEINVDLTQPRSRLGLNAALKMASKRDGLRAVSFLIGESLSERDDHRRKYQMRLKSARLDSTDIEFVQEERESGFTVFLPNSVNAKSTFVLGLELEGDFLTQPDGFPNCNYPRSNSSWYPRHGYLDRSTFDFNYTHGKKMKVASVGKRVSEEPDPGNKDNTITKYTMTYPVALVTFAVGIFERHSDTIKWESGDRQRRSSSTRCPAPHLRSKKILFLPNLIIRFDFFRIYLASIHTKVTVAVFHPYGFGQGFATMLTIPKH